MPILETLKNLNYTEILATLGVESIASGLFRSTKQYLLGKRLKELDNPEKSYLIELTESEEEMFKQLEYSLDEAWAWCNIIQFKDLQQKRSLTNVFIPLDFYLTPKSLHLDSEIERKESIDEILKNVDCSLILLGGPGAGKSTLTKYLTQLCFAQAEILQHNFNFPLVIRLSELNSYNVYRSFFELILAKIGIVLKFKEEKPSNNVFIMPESHVGDGEKPIHYDFIKRFTIKVLDELNVLLILDGYDEVIDPKLASLILKDVQALCFGLQSAKVILTVRTGEFDLDLQNARTLEICSLTDAQIKTFVTKWINDEDKGNKLYEQILNSPFHDAAIRPLNVAHLCALYLRYHEIPKQPKTVYSKIISLLIEEWDIQRGVVRTSQYSNFTVQRKEEFLSALAYRLSTQFHTFIFSTATVNAAYHEICSSFRLPRNEARIVIREIESHTGLFINSGFDKFEFSHKSLHEYLTALYIVKSPYLLNITESVYSLGNEFAIAIALGSDPDMWLYTLATTLQVSEKCTSFVRTLLLRLTIERPDFSSSSFLATAIAFLYSKTYLDDIPDILWENFLLSHSNIEVAFREMSEYFVLKNRQQQTIDMKDLDLKTFIEIKQMSRLAYGTPNSYFLLKLNKSMAKWFLKL